MNCLRKNISYGYTDQTDVTGTQSYIEEPSTVNARVVPAWVPGRGLAYNDCLAITSDWVSGDEKVNRY